MDFITQNIGTVAVLAVLAVIVVLIVVKMHNDKKEGKGTCGCECSTCAMKDACHKEKK